MRAADPPPDPGLLADLPGIDLLQRTTASRGWAAPDPDPPEPATGHRPDADLLLDTPMPAGRLPPVGLEPATSAASWQLPPPTAAGTAPGAGDRWRRAIPAVTAAVSDARELSGRTRWPTVGPAERPVAPDAVSTGVRAQPWAVGGVATWLPEGRWADADEAPTPDVAAGRERGAAHGRDDDQRRRRGRRRLAGTRLLARLAGWPRQLVAAALLLAAVVVALRPDTPTPALGPPPAGTAVVVAARDTPAGAILAKTDLRVVALPADLVPAGTAHEVTAVLGRTLAGALRRGEAVTDARLVGPGLTTGLGPQESSATPVRLADAQAAALVRPGDRVDVLATPVDTAGSAGPADAVEVAAGVRVLAVLRGGQAAEGVVLVVAAAPAVARRLAGAAGRSRLTVTVRPP